MRLSDLPLLILLATSYIRGFVMSKVGEFMLKETTRTSLTLANFLILIGTVVTFTYAAATWKSQIESRIKIVEENQISVESRVNDLEALSVDTKTTLAEIQTDLKWIRNALEAD